MILHLTANASLLKPCQVMQRSNSRLRRCTHHSQQHQDVPLLSFEEPTSSSMSATFPWHIKVLSAVNDSTKWTVSGTVLAVLLWQHNEYAAWCVVGAVLSSFICKVLKHLLNHERPDNAPKSDPGMPSSHANSLNFLAVYAALSLGYHTHNASWALALAAATVALGAFKTWLRVFLGFHTWPQVLVGAALGASSAITWFQLGTAWVLPALQQSRAGLATLYVVTGLGSAAFGAKIVSSWWREQQRRRQQQQDELQQQGMGLQQQEEVQQLLSEQGLQLRYSTQQQQAAAEQQAVVLTAAAAAT